MGLPSSVPHATLLWFISGILYFFIFSSSSICCSNLSLSKQACWCSSLTRDLAIPNRAFAHLTGFLSHFTSQMRTCLFPLSPCSAPSFCPSSPVVRNALMGTTANGHHQKQLVQTELVLLRGEPSVKKRLCCLHNPSVQLKDANCSWKHGNK